MPVFRIHRMKDQARQHFRWAPHTSGAAEVKPKDFEPRGEVEAASLYDAWTLLRGTGQPLEIGDVLESPGGALSICKYVGFEEARWHVPEPRPPAAEPAPTPPQTA